MLPHTLQGGGRMGMPGHKSEAVVLDLSAGGFQAAPHQEDGKLWATLSEAILDGLPVAFPPVRRRMELNP